MSNEIYIYYIIIAFFIGFSLSGIIFYFLFKVKYDAKLQNLTNEANIKLQSINDKLISQKELYEQKLQNKQREFELKQDSFKEK